MSLLEIKNITKIYSSRKEELRVLDGFSENLNNGELVALTGPSGAGKSTLLHIIGGLDKPNGGEIIFDNKNLYSMTHNELNQFRGKNIGFIFQFHYLLDDFTALENVMMPMLLLGAKKPSAEEKAKDLLLSVGLLERASHYPSELSGGEQQRVSLARSIINEPKLILADEPTGNLDSANSKAVLSILKKLSEKGTAVLIVTHDESIASSCDREIKLIKK